MSHFRYSLNSSTIKPTPILEKIEIAAETGYGAIELWHDDIDRFLATGGTINDLKNALDDHGSRGSHDDHAQRLVRTGR